MVKSEPQTSKSIGEMTLSELLEQASKIKLEEFNQFLEKFNKPDQDLVGSMTKAELKALIAETVREVMRQEISGKSLKAEIEKIKSLEYDSEC
jgi:hypothetical protein